MVKNKPYVLQPEEERLQTVYYKELKRMLEAKELKDWQIRQTGLQEVREDVESPYDVAGMGSYRGSAVL